MVLAGGAARRLGGVSKPLLPVGGRPMLARVLDAVASADPRIVVGPGVLATALPPGTILTCEDPPGGGPVAGLGAAMAVLEAGERAVGVLAGDLPLVVPSTLAELRRALAARTDAQVALVVDPAGRRQPLLSVWREPALRAALHGLGGPAGQSMRRLLDGTTAVEVQASGTSYLDCDTAEDLLVAERLSD